VVDSASGTGEAGNSLSPHSTAPLEDRRGALDRRRPDPLSTARAHGSQTDEQLVAAVRRAEQGAFDTLAARYEKRLLGFCQQILRSREDAEDALQDVFTCAFNAILADERPIQVRPWLYRIAKNRCINQLRRATAIAVDSMDDRYADRGLTLVDKVLTRQNFRDLVADVKTLPDTQRVALLLREIDGFAYERIAIAMSTTVPAVKSLLVRARTGLLTSAEVREATEAAPGLIPPPRRNRARPRSAAAETLTYRGALAAASAATTQHAPRASASIALAQRRSPTRGGRQPGPKTRAIPTTSVPQVRRPRIPAAG
jgi:RNA polymerase sigma factor (sigma-70 family)